MNVDVDADYIKKWAVHCLSSGSEQTQRILRAINTMHSNDVHFVLAALIVARTGALPFHLPLRD